MSTRKRFRELIARGRLVPMPGAYDALSAKIMEAEGFEAIIAGGYAAIGSMMGQADMVQCARLCRPLCPHLRGGKHSGLCGRRYRLRRRPQCPRDGAGVRGGGRR